MTVFLLLYPESCLKAARTGLNLWFSIVLPSLFPFMAASFLLLETGIVKFISYIFEPVTRFLFSAPGESAYILFASCFSGYPIGARLSGELYAKKQISQNEAQSIIRFTSVSGPIFIMGAVSAGMLGNPKTGVYLASAHYLSAIFTGVVFGIFEKHTDNYLRSNNFNNKNKFKMAVTYFKSELNKCKPFGELLSDSVEKALITLFKIGGLIIFFSVIMEILSISGVMNIVAFIYSPFMRLAGMDPESIKVMLIGGIEMTNGCSAAASMSIGALDKLPILSSIIAFGGMCIHMQTKSVCVQSGLIPKYFLLAKSIQAFFAYQLCCMLILIFPFPGSVSLSVRNAAIVGFAVLSLLLAVFIFIKIKRSTDKINMPDFRLIRNRFLKGSTKKSLFKYK